MRSTVCTLFENHYHEGVVALTNSLYNQGYRGDIYAGYRGELPDWTKKAERNTAIGWDGAVSLTISSDLSIHFLPIHTEYHLSNFKPNFMLRLWEILPENIEAMAYFDPDIVNKCPWSFYETWMDNGVALVHEITSNDMPPTHPLRLEWEKVLEKCGRKSIRRTHSYINAGFCGVARKHIEFLKLWLEIMDTAIKHYNVTPDQWDHSLPRSFVFYVFDQDALNIAAMACSSPISEMGPEAMDFTPGGWTMSHAVGSPKPWKKKFILSALKGVPPSLTDRAFWFNVESPLNYYNASMVRRKRLSVNVAALIGRFYSRR
ncbi:hypothetical protein [Desertivirga arenae]|uniref:hypothetical protein n=1 Tax=Desertivirga arenae TaxID=2810309 RepID=UPI001A961B8B|nr:hypothetical protein [Pedobacter sp. SYSU D00823]